MSGKIQDRFDVLLHKFLSCISKFRMRDVVGPTIQHNVLTDRSLNTLFSLKLMSLEISITRIKGNVSFLLICVYVSSEK